MNPATAALTALSPLDGRYKRQTALLAAYFSEFGLIRYRVRVEVEYLLALREALGRPTDEETAGRLRDLYRHFAAGDAQAVKDHEATIRHDVKAVEYWLKAKVAELPGVAPDVELVHAGLTSEDVNNLAYALMHKEAMSQVMLPALANVLEPLMDLVAAHRALPMPARTHGQPATPTTMGKELGVFLARLGNETRRLVNIELPGKLNGATGTFAAQALAFPQVDWPAFSKQFITGMGLQPNLLTTQIEPHDGLAVLYDSFRRLDNVLIDFCQDMWRYISDGYFRQKVRAEEVGSSAMPHKVNPIDFENAEGNAGLANALFAFMGDKLTRSRLQRDLSDSTVLRNAGVAFGHALLALHNVTKGLARVDVDEARLAAELDAHPEVIAEAIQTILRAEGAEVPYEKLKALTRGRQVTLDELRAAATGALPERADSWATLSPATYVGLAPQLADEALKAARALPSIISKRQLKER
jgi:adenylosuccinate lyase